MKAFALCSQTPGAMCPRPVQGARLPREVWPQGPRPWHGWPGGRGAGPPRPPGQLGLFLSPGSWREPHLHIAGCPQDCTGWGRASHCEERSSMPRGVNGPCSVPFAVSWGDARTGSQGRNEIEKGKSANAWPVFDLECNPIPRHVPRVWGSSCHL